MSSNGSSGRGCGYCGSTEPADEDAGWAYKAEDLEGWERSGGEIEAVLQDGAPLFCSLDCADEAANNTDSLPIDSKEDSQ